MNDYIYFVTGEKGGCGKSLMAIVLVALLYREGLKVILVEADSTNCEAFLAYDKVDGVTCEAIDLDTKDGWMTLADLAQNNPESVIVVDTGARQEIGAESSLPFLIECLQELDRKHVTFWMMNPQRASVELLRDFIEAVQDTQVHAVRNCYFRDPEGFKTYNDSKFARTEVEKSGSTIDLPVLGQRVADKIYNDRLAPHLIVENGLISERVEMQRWLQRVSDALGDAIHV